MDDQNQQGQGQNSAEPTTAPILDVQPSKQDNLAVTPTEQQVSSAPADAMAPAPSPAVDNNADSTKPTEPNNPAVAPDPVKQPELAAPKKHGSPVLVIVIALLVAAALAIFTIMAFTQQDKKASKQQSDNDTAQSNVNGDVTPETVDETRAEVETVIKELDDSADFPVNELSDTNLGL